MKIGGRVLAGWLFGCSVLALLLSGSGEAAARHAGIVMAVDKTAGTIVMGDMGPLLANGKSEITRYTVQVTLSTQFVLVKRTSGVAPSGWIGDYVETNLPAWEVKPGDWVTIAGETQGQRVKAAKITVVDMSEP